MNLQDECDELLTGLEGTLLNALRNDIQFDLEFLDDFRERCYMLMEFLADIFDPEENRRMAAAFDEVGLVGFKRDDRRAH